MKVSDYSTKGWGDAFFVRNSVVIPREFIVKQSAHRRWFEVEGYKIYGGK